MGEFAKGCGLETMLSVESPKTLGIRAWRQWMAVEKAFTIGESGSDQRLELGGVRTAVCTCSYCVLSRRKRLLFLEIAGLRAKVWESLSTRGQS